MRIFNNPLLKLVNSYIIDSAQPSNLSYLWIFGSLLAICLVIQIVTGLITLSRNIANLDTGVITSYALYILIGFIFYILIPYLSLVDNSILLLILLSFFSSNINASNYVEYNNNNTILRSNIFSSLCGFIIKFINYNAFTKSLSKITVIIFSKACFNWQGGLIFNYVNIVAALFTPLSVISLFLFALYSIFISILFDKFEIKRGHYISLIIATLLLIFRVWGGGGFS